MVASYRDLRVWRAGMQLVRAVYRASEGFPKTELFGLTSQMRRAAVSVPSNIAEGHTRAYTREYLQHAVIAHGSVAELITQIEIAADLGYIEPAAAAEVSTQADALSRQLNALRTALADRLPHPSPLTPHSWNVP